MKTVVLALCLLSPLGLLAGEIKGTVLVTNKRGKPIKLDQDPVVLYLDGFSQAIPANLVSKRYKMNTRKKQFSPRILVVPKGATVTFTNFDPLFHNAFSVSGKNSFDGGLFKRGKEVKKRFDHKGLVRVYCNVHHAMSALVFIAENPFYSISDTGGNFTLKNVKPGTYTLTALHRLGGSLKRQITVGTGPTKPIQLQLSSKNKRVKKHKNKNGKAYKRRRSGRY